MNKHMQSTQFNGPIPSYIGTLQAVVDGAKPALSIPTMMITKEMQLCSE